MSSIQQKIRRALVGSINVALGFVALMLAAFLLAISGNQARIDVMIREYSIISRADEIVLSYNAIIKNPTNRTLRTTYDSQHAGLQTLLATLLTQANGRDTQPILIGLQHTVDALLTECDTGIADMEKNNFASTSGHYTQALKYSEYVGENTRNLLQEELEDLYHDQQRIQWTYYWSIAAIVGAMAALAIAMIIYARRLTKQIVDPLEQLADYAKRVAADATAASQQMDMTNADEEIRSLSISIQTMIGSLTNAMLTLEKANDDLTRAKATLEEKNAELASMNKLMVGRELKMVEMKKQLSELTGK
jgi:methyl-accepting chemotaxis protein